MRWLAPVLLALAMACSVSLVADGIAVVCDADDDCPTGRCEIALRRCFAAGSGTPLRLTSAVAVSSVRVDAVFNQAVAPGSVVDLGQVTIEPALTITGIALDPSNQRLSVTTAPQAFDVTYTLTVAGFVSNLGDALDAEARTQSFVSYLGLADRSPPAIIRPADGSRVVGGDVEFAWQAISNVTTYTIEVQRRDDVAAPIVVEVPGGTTLTTINLPLEGTYDWRVRADVTTPGVYNSAAFDALVDAVYVSCPDGECPARIGNGSRRAPLQRITEGLALAQQLGLVTVRIAARSNGGSYEEVLVLADTGVTVDGGFDASFTPGAGRAEISAVGTVLVARPSVEPLRIKGVLLSALQAPILEVVSVEGATNITLEDVVIMAEPTNESSIGISADGRPGVADVHLDGVTMLLPGSLFATELLVGIRARETRLVVNDSLVSVGVERAATEVLEARGIELLGSAAFNATRVDVAVGYSMIFSTALFDDRLARPVGAVPYDVIDSSRFWVPVARETIVTLFNSRIRELVVRNSVIVAGAAPLAEAVRLGPTGGTGVGPRFIHDFIQVTSERPADAINSSRKGFVVANSFITAAPCTSLECATSTNPCIDTNNDSGPSTLVGTALACQVPYVGTGLGAPDFNAPSPTCTDGMGRVIRCDGTFMVAPPIDGFFADLDGPDGAIAEARDNDYHLVPAAPAALRSGGATITGNVCGYADQALPCEAGSVDADGTPRSAPFSIGPYEY